MMKSALLNLLSMVTDSKHLWLLIGLNGVLFLVLIFNITYQFLINYTLWNNSASREITNISAFTNLKSSKIITLDTWHLFGAKETVKEGTIQPLVNNTQWILRGIILGTQEANNMAVIATSDNDEAIYQRGSKLADGAIIKSISNDRVLLNHNGHEEYLLITWNGENQAIITPAKETPLHLGKPFSLMREP